jgi:hypothetical protein
MSMAVAFHVGESTDAEQQVAVIPDGGRWCVDTDYTLRVFDAHGNVQCAEGPIGSLRFGSAFDAASPAASDERFAQILARHRRQILASPGVGEERQTYALAVIDDIENDVAAGRGGDG